MCCFVLLLHSCSFLCYLLLFRPSGIVEELEPVLDEDTGSFVARLWRLLLVNTILLQAGLNPST